MNNQLAQIICQAFGQPQYSSKCLSTTKANAQAMLEGRTHYVDDSTMRYFNSRITLAQPSTFGMFYLITESVSFDPQNTKRGFRCVLFDINGGVVYRPNLEELENTSTKAEKTFYKWFESFNAEIYYKQQIKEKIIQINRQAQNLEECLGSFEKVAA
jgi:hypothetical protein